MNFFVLLVAFVFPTAPILDENKNILINATQKNKNKKKKSDLLMESRSKSKSKGKQQSNQSNSTTTTTSSTSTTTTTATSSTSSSNQQQPQPQQQSQTIQQSILNEQQRSDNDAIPLHSVNNLMKRALPQNSRLSKEVVSSMKECVSEFISFVTSE